MTSKASSVKKKTSIGGQALIEGIMMRGPKTIAMAVRNPSGEIILEKTDVSGKKTPLFFRIPLIRGIYGMVSSFTIGYKCLMRSAEIAGEEVISAAEATPESSDSLPVEEGADAAADTAEKAPEEMTTDAEERAKTSAAPKTTGVQIRQVSGNGEASGEKAQKNEKEGGIAKWIWNAVMIVGTVLGVLLSIGLFIYLPKLLFNLVIVRLGGLERPAPTAPYGERYLYQMLISAFTGVLKIAIFVGYMWAVSLMKDIRRTFMYHGAEHKTIFCYEKGLPLTVENIRKQTRFHPRCGTSFMIVMLLVSIIIGCFVPLCDDRLYVLIKLLLVPVAVGIGYEFIKFAGKHDNLLVRILSAPGLWMQRISTREPDDSMIECAVAAMNEVIPNDGSDCL